jgi:hypothetical protein
MSRYRRLLLLCMIAAFSFCVPSVSPAHAGFWERLQKVYEDVRKFFSRTAGDVEKGLDHFGREFEKEFCDFFTAGRASRGEAGCGINGGVGVDKEGVYTYDPQQPDQKFRGTSRDPAKTEEDRLLGEFARFVSESQIRTWEYEDQDVHGIRRFLPPDAVLGEAWPDGAHALKPPTKSGTIRPCCKGGGGGFLSPRSDNGKIRFHAGVDYLAVPGEPIYEPASGSIERIKNPGRPGLAGLLIVDAAGYSASIYYVEPTPEIKEKLLHPSPDSEKIKVEAGQTLIGHAQAIHPIYPADVPNHVHVTLTDPNGNPVSPDARMRIKKTPTGR